MNEKSQVQALGRSQPGLPLRRGRCGTMTYGCKRHGTATLFAALNVLDGRAIGRGRQRQRRQQFIRVPNTVEGQVPAGTLVRAVVDTYATHQHPRALERLARHPRWTCRVTLTSFSWLNAVEGSFAELTRCLVPGFGGADFRQAWKDALWAKFNTGAPQRQRRSVERYSIVKRA